MNFLIVSNLGHLYGTQVLVYSAKNDKLLELEYLRLEV